MKKQTAVQWLWLNLTDDLIGELSPDQIKSIYQLIKKAKAMEQEQIVDAWIDGQREQIVNGRMDKEGYNTLIAFIDANLYYQATYGGGEE